MRCYTLALALLTAVAATPTAQAQTTGTRVGLKAGASISSLSGTLNADPKTRVGPALGLMLRLKPSAQRFAVQTELLLSSQGAHLEARTAPGASTITRVKRNATYANLPILLRQYLGGPVYVNVGPQLGLMLGPSRSQLKPADLSVTAGIGFESTKGFVVDARYNYGVLDVENNSDDKIMRERLGLGGLHNRVIQVSAGWLFGSRQ